MEYQVQLKNVFNREAVLDVLRGGRASADPLGTSALLRPYQANTAPLLSPTVLGKPHGLQAGRPPVQQTADFALYFLSSKGGQEKDYYLLDNRCLIYDRQIKWAYWEEALPTLANLDGLEVTAAQLKAICPPASMADIRKHITHLNTAMAKYQINTRLRQAHFLAQVSLESDRFRTAREYADGSDYEGRIDIGNTQPGDGKRFRGRGLIQLTGRDVYTQYSDYVGRDFTEGDNMLLVEQEPYASDASGWFWFVYKAGKDINARADRDDVAAVTRAVNGGKNGLDFRIEYTNNAKKVFALK